MAVETTTKQMALTRDLAPGGFMERVLAMMSRVAGDVLAEPGSTAYHQPRAFYAQNVVKNPLMASQSGAPIVVMGVNVVNTTTYDEETKMSTCTIADLDLQSQIMTLWNALAAIDTSA